MLLDLSSFLASYSPQYPLTKAYQYLSRTLLFNTINDSLDNPKPTVIVQASIYNRATTICPCPIIHSTNKHIPYMCDQCFELRRKFPKRRADKGKHICPTCNSNSTTTIPLLTSPTLCKSCIFFAFIHQKHKPFSERLSWTPPNLTHELNTIWCLPDRKVLPLLFSVVYIPYTHPSSQSPNLARITSDIFNIFLPPTAHNLTQTPLRDAYDQTQPPKYTTYIPHVKIPFGLVYLHYLRNPLHTPCHTPIPDPILYHYLYLTHQLRTVQEIVQV